VNKLTGLVVAIWAGCSGVAAGQEMPDAADLKPWVAHGWVGLTAAGDRYDRVEYLYTGVAPRTGSVRTIWVAAVMPFREFPPQRWIARGYRSSISQYWVDCSDGSSDLRSLTYFSDVSAYNVILNAGFNHSTSVPVRFTEPRTGGVDGAIVQAACK
jgi:hypothetical protein